ncbi:hypothetical protein ACIP2X_38085 [Streptomyces sp. NPDC089424]|uniref:hypothetical protein n=1 Tax=Streptomyces sp. NPDC089424 TaxID=3365917 RepID=UPI0037FF90CE
MAIDDAQGGSKGYLSPNAEKAFALIAAGQDPTPDMPSEVAELEEWGFVVRDPATGNRPVALDPQHVSRRRVQQELEAAAKHLAFLTAAPKVTDQLAEAFNRAKLHAAGGSEFIADPAVVHARLESEVGAAEWEILSAQPGGPRTEEQLAKVAQRDTEALDRGVSKRTIYLDTVRGNAVTARYAKAMSQRADGKRAQYRTLGCPFERCIIVDRRVAFVSNHLVEGADEHSAWQITDRGMVAYIAAEFDSKWRAGIPWCGELSDGSLPAWTGEPGGEGLRTTRRQREILRDLLAGHTQEATASRLGIGLRTVTTELAELKALFDASSAMELGYKWGLSPDRLVHDVVRSDPPVDGSLPAA